MKYILSIVILLIAATVYFISRPQPEFVVGNVKEPMPVETVQGPVESAPETAAEMPEQQAGDERVALMKSEFEKLEKARRNLERRLSRLKAVLYGKEIASEERNEITENMMNGYGLLKHKKLLAVYDSPREITDELMRVEYINQYLEEVENKYRNMRLQ